MPTTTPRNNRPLTLLELCIPLCHQWLSLSSLAPTWVPPHDVGQWLSNYLLVTFCSVTMVMYVAYLPSFHDKLKVLHVLTGTSNGCYIPTYIAGSLQFCILQASLTLAAPSNQQYHLYTITYYSSLFGWSSGARLSAVWGHLGHLAGNQIKSMNIITVLPVVLYITCCYNVVCDNKQ